MNLSSLRVVFMGTPEFAQASLEALLKAGCNIVAVVTAPDKPAGRGLKIHESTVKKYAVEKGLKVLQPEKLKDPEFLADLKALQPDIQVVVAFRMLPEMVWSLPPRGTINLHASLLPQYRGAAPINRALIDGETETGLTTFRLKQEIDTGDILLQVKIPIGADETAGELHDRMKIAGGELLVRTLQGLADGNLQAEPQELYAVDQLRPAPKINTPDCRINFSCPVEKVYNHIRGLSPYPGAFTIINEKMLKVFSAEKEVITPAHTEGDYVTDGKQFLKFCCSNGYIHLKEVQLEGKKKIKIEEFLRGFRFEGNQ
jgi:methionyl-tRNA formyltransferase